MTTSSSGANSRSTGSSNSRRRWGLWLLIGFTGAVILAPHVVAATSLRDDLLQRLIGEPDLQVSSTGAKLGWFSPLQIEGLEIRQANGDVTITVAAAQAESSWFKMWWSLPAIGNIDLVQPRVDIRVSDEALGEDDVRWSGVESCPIFSTQITDGEVVIRDKESGDPVVEVTEVEVSVRTEQRDGGVMLLIDRIQLAQRAELTQEVSDHGLQLIAPIFVDEIAAEGEFSIELTKTELWLGPDDDPQPSQIEGLLSIHQLNVGLKNEATRRLARLGADLLEMGGLPDRLRVTENAELKFRFTDRSVSHESVANFFPELTPGLTLKTAGTVDLDEQLDLTLQFDVPVSMLDDSSLGSELAKSPLMIRATGTFDEPNVRIPADQPWVRLVRSRLASTDVAPRDARLARRVLEAIGDLLAEPSSSADRS